MKSEFSVGLADRFCGAWAAEGGTPEELNLLAENQSTVKAFLGVLRGELVIKAAELLKFVRNVAVGAVSKFVATDAFGPNNPDGIKFYLGNNFKTNFLGKIEEDVEVATIVVHRLERISRSPEIMAELGVENRVIKLAHFYEMLKIQNQGQDGPLLVNRYANIAYIEDENGTVWAVNAGWGSVDREWYVDAISVENPDEWGGGHQVLSR